MLYIDLDSVMCTSNNYCTGHVEAISHSFNAKAINLVPDCYAIFAEFIKESGFN